MDGLDDIPAQLAALEQEGTPVETISMLQQVYEEHPDAVAIVISLLKSGWKIKPHGEQIICVTLRSPTGAFEVLGHGISTLDAFEEIQLKTRNFSKLLSCLEG